MSAKTPIGSKFFGLTYIARIPTEKGKSTRGLFSCECGGEHEAYLSNVKRGHSKYCSLCSKSKIDYASRELKTHGLSRNPKTRKIHMVWRTMNHRCHNIKSNSYHNYGARGIQVCDEWRNDPKLFCDWAFNNGYAEGLEIDRIDNNGNYSPDNCRFVSLSENARNRRVTCKITYKGVTKPLIEFAEEYGLRYKTLFNRVFYLKLPIEIALNKKLNVLSNKRVPKSKPS